MPTQCPSTDADAESDAAADVSDVSDDASPDVGTDVAPAGSSCEGKCGKYVEGDACQCDSACADYGDCCADLGQVCGACTDDSECADKDPCTLDVCKGDGCAHIPIEGCGKVVCGDGTCAGAETPSTCPADCKAGPCQGAACACTAGACCDIAKGAFRPKGSACGTAIVGTEQQCQNNAVYQRSSSGGCTGGSTSCSAAAADLVWGGWALKQPCGDATPCAQSGKTAVCTPKSDCSGPCCDPVSGGPAAAGTKCGSAVVSEKLTCMGGHPWERKAYAGCTGKSTTDCSTSAAYLHWTKPMQSTTCAASMSCEDGKCVAPTPGPDLVALSFVAKSSAKIYKPGSAVALGCSWQNAGGKSTGNYGRAVVLRAPGAATGKILKSWSQQSLAPKAKVTADCSVKLPSNLAHGSWRLVMRLDHTSTVSEQHEKNNLLELDVTVGACLAGACCAPSTLTLRPKGSQCGHTVRKTETQCSTIGSSYLKVRKAFNGCSGKSSACSLSSSYYHWTTWKSVPCDGGAKCQIVSKKATCLTKANLEPLPLNVSPLSAKPGGTILVGIYRKNSGGVKTGTFTDALYLSKSAYFSSTKKLLWQKKTSYGLSPGQLRSVLPAPKITIPTGTTPGKWYLHYMVDADKHVPESDEKDNTYKRPITVKALEPDLTVTTLASSTKKLKAGQAVTLSYGVKNIGDGAAGSHVDRIVLSSNKTLSSSDKVLYSVNRSGLTAGKSRSGSQKVTIPTTTKTGTWYVGYWTDASDKVAKEMSESNNKRIVTLSVADAPQCTKADVCCDTKNQLFQPKRTQCGFKPINFKTKCVGNTIYRQTSHAGCTGKSATQCSYASSYLYTSPWEKLTSCTGNSKCQTVGGKAVCAECTWGRCCDTKKLKLKPKGSKCGKKLLAMYGCASTTKATRRKYYAGCSGSHHDTCESFYDQAYWVGGTQTYACTNLEVCSVKLTQYCDQKFHQCAPSDPCCEKSTKKGVTWWRYKHKGAFCGTSTTAKPKYACTSTKLQTYKRTRLCTGSSGKCSGSSKYHLWTSESCGGGKVCNKYTGTCNKKDYGSCTEAKKWASYHKSKNVMCLSKSAIGSKCTAGYASECQWCEKLAKAMCSGKMDPKIIDKHQKRMKSCKTPCTKLY